jgi:putative NADPH-quinone reductase
MSAKVLVLHGHPDESSFCSALSRAYAAGARGAAAEVRELHLGALEFDPVLRAGYAKAPALEPDLLAAQEAMRWADHLVWSYPIWWGLPPALVKGFVERVFAPDFAFRRREGSLLPEALLKGRSARLLVTMDAPPWYYRWITGAPAHRAMSRATLGYCGVSPVRISEFGSVRGSSEAKRAAWLKVAGELGRLRA